MKYLILLMAFLTMDFSPVKAQEEIYPEDEMVEYEEANTEYIAPEEQVSEDFHQGEEAPLSDESWGYYEEPENLEY